MPACFHASHNDGLIPLAPKARINCPARGILSEQQEKASCCLDTVSGSSNFSIQDLFRLNVSNVL